MNLLGDMLATLRDIRACLRVLILLQLADKSGRLPEVEQDRLEQLLARERS